jgi:hypothetical protein
MVVEVTTYDDNPTVEYAVQGEDLCVKVQPGEDESQVIVEVWDAAGCSAREARPADQAEKIALRTLFNEVRADREVVPV